MIWPTPTTRTLTSLPVHSSSALIHRTPQVNSSALTAQLVYSVSVIRPQTDRPSLQLPLGYHVWDVPFDNTSARPLSEAPDELRSHSYFFMTDADEPASIHVYQLDLCTKNPPPTDESPTPVYITRRYKPVAKRIKPVPTTLPEQFRIQRRPVPNALDDIPTLPTHPPDFVSGKRYTQERKDANKQNATGFLWPEEEKLAHELIRLQEDALAWVELEKGSFSSEYFDPIVFPVVEHIPWQYRNIPIPPGKYDEIIGIIKDKIATGVYEPSNSSYRSRWFCVFKKDGKSLRIVHDLQPLNAVSIQDRGVPPISEPYAESFGGRACYGVFDLFVSFDQRVLDPSSRDMTTFQTPLGTYRLTRIPMGYTNSVQIMQGDVTHILQDEIPAFTIPFIDDVPVKGPPIRYQLDDRSYETIPGNTGIRRFVWEHMQTMNRILQRVKKVGGTFNGKKLEVCVPEIDIVGHHCTYDGRVPSATKTAVIENWPPCKTLTEARAFLGTCGLFRIFIRNYSLRARAIQCLTRKDVPFEWGPTQQAAMDDLKLAVATSSALRAIDYSSPKPVILAVDSSNLATGYALFQIGHDDKRYPSRFGSITWNERESRYSQAKIELYGLFRALRAFRLYIIGVLRLQVEVDAKYVKGMLNNPDIQPNATINRWIAAILLFDFELIHVPGTQHTGVDGLSRRPANDNEHQENPAVIEDWIDDACGFAIEALNRRQVSFPRVPAPSDADIDLDFDIDDHRAPSALPAAPILATDAPPIEIPRSEKARRQDEHLTAVTEFLRTASKPIDYTELQLRQLVRYASKFFILDNKLWRRHPTGRHRLVLPPERRSAILIEAHDDLGHKGIYATRTRILDRFWWPYIEQDIAWFVRTCHICQTRQVHKIHIPPVVSRPPSLFRKAHIDTMFMPRSGGFKYVAHARCALSAYPEMRMLRQETGRALGTFIFEDILCRWGALEEIVTDNGPAFIKALDYLAHRYKINHIRISAYNSQANGIIERAHRPLWDSLIKAADGDETKWSLGGPTVLWAERVTTHRTTGYSPYWIAHGVEPLFPFDLAEATYMCPPQDAPTAPDDLIALRARQLQKRPEDLATIAS